MNVIYKLFFGQTQKNANGFGGAIVLWIKKFTLLRQTFVKASKKSEFYRGEIGGKCDLVAKSGVHADFMFWGVLI